MKTALTTLLLLTSALAFPLHAEHPPSATAGIELRLQQLDMDMAFRQYERVKMELFKVDFDLALKGVEASDAEKSTVAKKIEMLAKRAERLQKEIRERAEKIAAAQRQAQPKMNIVQAPAPVEIAKPSAKPSAKPEEKKPVAATAPDSKAAEAELTNTQKKFDALGVEYAKLREARGKLTEDTIEYAAADKLVQDTKQELQKAAIFVHAAKAKLREAQSKVDSVHAPVQLDLAKLSPKPEEKRPAAGPTPDSKAVEAEIAGSQKKLDALNAEIAKRREARGKLDDDAPEYAAADKLVQAIKPEMEKARAAVEAAKAKLKKP